MIQQEKQVVAYKTVSFSTVTDSGDARINKLIAEGWQLHGSPVSNGDKIAQAMVKYATPSKTATAARGRDLEPVDGEVSDVE